MKLEEPYEGKCIAFVKTDKNKSIMNRLSRTAVHRACRNVLWEGWGEIPLPDPIGDNVKISFPIKILYLN